MELDMEIGEGQPQGCPFFFGGGGRERRFWREYAAGQRSASDAWIFRAVPLSLRKHAKDGEKSAQLAFGSNKCRLSPNAFSHELRGNHARKIMRLSLEADRQLVVAVRRKSSYIT